MNLQVCAPAQKCIYNCPYCCARGRKHQNKFKNLYASNYQKWQEKLLMECMQNEIETVVVTGTNEPTQDPYFIKAVLDTLDMLQVKPKVELQTKSMDVQDYYDRFDVVAISIDRFEQLKNLPDIPNRRDVILLTKDFSNSLLEDILIERNSDGNKEVTFKVLQDTNGTNKEIDQWIAENKAPDKYVNNLFCNLARPYFVGYSLRLDENCMDADGRYLIFREDGNLYTDWDSIEPYHVRFTEYHAAVAVTKDKNLLPEAMKKLEKYENEEKLAKHIKMIANHYGSKSQSHKCIEEMSELTKEICKFVLANTDKERICIIENIREEIADVQIMIEQMKVLFGEEEVNEYIAKKVKRQIDRIKKEKDE